VKLGDRLGPFELLEFVGGGGMGRVFRAWDASLSRTVALKILPPDQAADEETFQRFVNEAQSAARLDHENVVRVYQVGEDRGLRFIAFEFVEGVDIRAIVERHGPLPLPEAVSYVVQVAEALVHAATRAVVHRDIKPSNVLVTPEGRVKLIDMGLARLRREGGSEADLTASGVTLGTFDYISPEQARDPRNADARSDIYSLGCAFFYMLAGRPPFPEGTVLQKLLQHQGDQPPDIRRFRRDIPDEAVRVMRKMLAKDPRQRYQHPGELVEDLLALAEHVGLRPRERSGRWLAVPRQRRVSAWRRHLPWLAPTAALVCIVLALDLSWRLLDNGNGVEPGGSAGLMAQSNPPDAPGRNPGSSPTEAGATPPGETPPSDAAPSGAPQEPGSGQGGTPPNGGETPSTDVEPGGRGPSPAPPSEAETPAPEQGLRPRVLERVSRTEPDESAAGLGPDSLSGGLTMAEAGPIAAVVLPSPEVGSLDAAASPGETSGEVAATPPVAGPPKRPGLLAVGDAVTDKDEYASLWAACAAAKSGDVIELRFDGHREERPLSLAGLNVTVRAGKGHRPVVVFRPGTIEAPAATRSMIGVVSGQLDLNNVAVELHVPRQVPAADWTLFETAGGQSIRLMGCSLTIFNAAEGIEPRAYHPDVAFFRASPAPGAGAGISENGEHGTMAAGVVLEDCVVRGEADLLCAGGLQPVEMTWKNGLLSISEALVSAVGGASSPPPQDRLNVRLSHVTAALRGGLLRAVSDRLNPHLLPVRFECSNSILIGVPGVPMIEQVGTVSLDRAREKLRYGGNRMFYEGFDVFWQIQAQDPASETALVAFEEWKQYWGEEIRPAMDEGGWEVLPSLDEVRWRGLPGAERPLHAHTPDDYALDDSAPNEGAIGAASDGRDAGLQADRLPALPDSARPAELPTAPVEPPTPPTEPSTPAAELPTPRAEGPAD
jgi:serine/threonine-protein kinase